MAKDATAPKPASSPSTIRDVTNDANRKPENEAYWPAIAHRDQLPKWLRDNDYILTGHPMPTHSYTRSYRLWRCLHMETMNIWTHFLGSAAFVATGLGLLVYAKTEKYSRALRGDELAFASSIISAALCFGLSSTFHTLRSHSYHVHHLWGKMDILGICVLALGGGTSATYYAFYGEATMQRVYWALCLCSSAAAVYTLFDTGGGGSKMRALRGGVFSLLAVSAMLPIFHSASSLGWARACQEIGVHWFLAEGLALLLGVGTFVGRLPERWSPGTFDIWGHSHQIFHMCAVVGTGFHIRALLTAYAFRHSS